MELIKDTAQFEEIYHKSCHQPELFWEEIASGFTWKKRWDKVLSWNFTEPNVQWFVNGKMNITENCLDRHLPEKANQIAFYWEPNSPDKSPRSFTYLSLYQEVNKVANSLKQYGIKKGDRICFYMPMVPELAIAILACARIGAIHSVVFAGFSAQSLADRIEDSQCKMVICSDFNDRGAKHIAVKQVVDDALLLPGCQCVENVLVYKNTGDEVKWYPERDLWWHDVVPPQSDVCEAEVMDSEDMLFILYTSGSTGKPKGVVHTCGGFMVYTAYSFKQVFQINDNDLYWCTADIGWITGHSYIVYGPLLVGATSLMFEGVPTYPDAGRFWEICDKYKVTHFYTAPTAIRALMAYGNSFVEKYELTSLKVLGSVGEPINEEAWHWYNEKVGKNRCPIVDTWWQTETGGIMISTLAGITPSIPSYATKPLPGIQPVLLSADGVELEGNEVEGLLCIKFPWPPFLEQLTAIMKGVDKPIFPCIQGTILPEMVQNGIKTEITELLEESMML